MSYEDLMARVAREIPELAGKLSAPRVTYVKSLKKTYITFESSVLAGEKQFLQLEKILKEVIPGRAMAVRIISPSLREAFLEDPSAYRQVLDDFLRRNYPMARGWIGQIGWQIEKNQLRGGTAVPADGEEAILTLVFPDEISLHLMQGRNAGARLAVAIKEIFDARVRVEMTVAGDREERLRKIREERENAEATITREEMQARLEAMGISTENAGDPADGKKPRVRKPKEKAERSERELSSAQEAS